MRSCIIVDFKTPKGYDLHGFLFGSQKPEQVVILVHGLAGSALGGVSKFIDGLCDSKTAVFTFNNRGYGIINKLYKDAPRTKKGYASTLSGAAHERFEDCVDDIEGAIRAAHALKPKRVFLVGHSTGCQKSAYWAAKKGEGVAGIVYLAPLSDYAGALALDGAANVRRAAAAARTLVKKGKAHELLPPDVWKSPVDAQRFLSLYTPDSVEQSIFSYFEPERRPAVLKKAKLPILVVLAEKDEYADRSATAIEGWFVEHLKIGDQVMIVPATGHSFRGKEGKVCGAIRSFMKV